MHSVIELKETLSKVLCGAFSDCRQLISIQQLSAGASLETYRIVYNGDEGTKTIALRRAPEKERSSSVVKRVGLDVEAQLFRLAKRKGVPSPSILYELSPGDQLGVGFFMDWIEGETLGYRINRAEKLAEVRPKLAYQCGEILGQIHSIDCYEEGIDRVLEKIDVKQRINSLWEVYQSLDVPYAMIDYTRCWLLDNAPVSSRLCLVHNDFRNGNLIVNSSGVAAVLDWEIAHIGNPMQDLGWICVNSWRFGNSQHPVGGFGQVQDMLEGYKAVTGMEITEKELKYWIVLGSYMWSIMTLIMANSWRNGESDSLERPAIGRRSSEAQMDCVNLMIPGDYKLPKLDKENRGTRLPVASELLSSVSGFLGDSLAANLDPHSKFLVKVAANSLGIVGRELDFGQELEAAEVERLKNLLERNEERLDDLRWQLVAAIRNGISLDFAGLTNHLRQTVAGQLFIDQPGYSALNK